MKTNKCKLCNCEDVEITSYKLRDNDEISVLKCKKCGLSFLSSFEHINNNFYENGNMHPNDNLKEDFEAWEKRSFEDDSRRFQFLKNKIRGKSVCDFGCGVGGFIKLAKNVTNSVCGVEKQQNLKPYFEKNNLNVKNDINEYKEQFDFITMFHVLEHLKNPKVELLQLTRKLKKNGELIIEVPNCDDALLSLYKNRAFADFTHWSCHLFMYNQKTLKMLLSSLNLKINYIKNVQRYSLMNHLYWLVKNKPGGHKVLSKYDFKILNFLYKSFLKTINKNDTIIISVSKSNMVL